MKNINCKRDIMIKFFILLFKSIEKCNFIQVLKHIQLYYYIFPIYHLSFIRIYQLHKKNAIKISLIYSTSKHVANHVTPHASTLPIRNVLWLPSKFNISCILSSTLSLIISCLSNPPVILFFFCHSERHIVIAIIVRFFNRKIKKMLMSLSI